ncbi:MAG: penicillin-binding transpeptidase domain-containing protein [Eubacterium sp.]|nr:penicillin-binding transpeptidase domain-containing protein [Eubacterium sp.]
MTATTSKKFLPFIIILGALILAVALYFIYTLTQTKPEQVLQDYMTAVNEGRYEDMYSMLSETAKADTSQEDFVTRNKNIYEGIEASSVKASAVSCTTENNTAKLSYLYEMDTVAGHYAKETEIQMTKAGRSYTIDWEDGMIIPSLLKGQKISVETTAAERGSIYDRNSKLLAGKGEALEVGLVPGKLSAQTRAQDLAALASLLSTTPEAIEASLSQEWVSDDVKVPLSTIGIDNTALETQLLAIPGVYTDTTELRVYPYGEKAAHLTGYVQGISAEELLAHKADGYVESAVIGKAGLEAAYESRLHGQDGAAIYIEGVYINDPDKEVIPWTVLERPAQRGQDVMTTIDADLQTKLYDQFAQDKGTSVAMNPKTGEVLALVSTPAYDPNAFILGLSEEEWNALSANTAMPLLSRLEASYAPGSSFKPVVGAVGITAGKLDPNADFGPSGTSWQKDASWGDLTITTLATYDGPANLENALIYSDNIYFAKAALAIGDTALADGLKKAGFEETIDFPLALTPSQIYGENGFANEGQLAQTGFGQGEVLVNPVHLACIYSAFVNDGSLIKPVLEAPEGFTPQYLKENAFSAEAASTIRNDLIQVVENPAGTAHEAQISGLSLAGKTGTAEIKASQDDATGTELGWFCAFTADTASAKQLLIVSMAEDVKDRGGSHYLVPKVRTVFE